MKPSVFIMEVENGLMVEQPHNGKKWFYDTLSEALTKVASLMTPPEKKPVLAEAATIVESPE